MDKRVVAITGGTSGIGKAAAFAFLKAGYAVAVCGRSEEKLRAFQKEAAEYTDSVLVHSADVCSLSSMRFFAEALLERFGRLDVWINNAGITLSRRFFYEYTPDEFDAVVAGNLKSVFFNTALAAEYMRPAGGVILQTSSFTAEIPTAGAALYGATKAAVNSLVKTMAAELAPDHIRVLAVEPAYVLTEMAAANISSDREMLLRNIPQRRLAVPEDVGHVFVFLASDEASYINGVSIPVTGGKMAVQNPMFGWERKNIL